MEVKLIGENSESGYDCVECNGIGNAKYLIIFGTDYDKENPVCEKCLQWINELWITKPDYAFDEKICKVLK